MNTTEDIAIAVLEEGGKEEERSLKWEKMFQAYSIVLDHMIQYEWFECNNSTETQRKH